MMMQRAPILLVAALAALTACTPSPTQGPGVQDPARRAESEYDLARDLWLSRGKPREALEHALKAVELDDDNAEAQHLAALLYLDFCARSANDCRLPNAERHARRALAL